MGVLSRVPYETRAWLPSPVGGFPAWCLTFDTPRGPVTVRKDHEGVHEAMWGLTSGKKDPKLGYPVLDQFKVYSAAETLPPEGMKTIDWIESWPAKK